MSLQKKGGWGFSSLVANLESRLDTILADDSEASAKERAALDAAKANQEKSSSSKVGSASSNVSTTVSRDASRTRTNDRLAERLARATAQKPPSRVSTPAEDTGSVRLSVESKRSSDIPWAVKNAASSVTSGENTEDIGAVSVGGDALENPGKEQDILAESSLPLNPAQTSSQGYLDSPDVIDDDGPRKTSFDTSNSIHTTARNSTDLPHGQEHAQASQAQAELEQQNEMHAYLERIDALQAKLTYLAKETVAAAKEANASALVDNHEKQLAAKDERIALLMEEGEKLSKTEMKNLQIIKKLRMKAADDEKTTIDLKKRLDRAERSETEIAIKLRRAEAAERLATEKTKQISAIEKQVDELKIDRENAAELVRSLTTQLKEAREKAEKAAKDAVAAERERLADLRTELEDAKIEKKLSEDRAAAEMRKTRDESQRQVERFAVHELEFKNEISGLESRLEAMRSRAEEASSGAGVEGESSVKLMRQVETLQQQYALAKSNWETIEGTLNARAAALEKERDEVSKRETDIRKKARDAGNRSRRAEDELEAAMDRVRHLEEELKSCQQQMKSAQKRLEQTMSAGADALAEHEKQRKLWDVEAARRLEEEKVKWRMEMMGTNQSLTGSPRTESHTSYTRKASATDIHRGKGLQRLGSHELSTLYTDHRPASRRSSAMPTSTSTRGLAISAEASPSLSRRESSLSLEPQTASSALSIEIDSHRPSEAGDLDDYTPSQRTVADLVSTSTAGPGPGPSVQLVERMSSLVRKLESEKASFKDELNRLGTQRDEARNEVVELMRELDSKRQNESKTAQLEKETAELRGRYDASLEMLGEREEEVEELRSDVEELKRIYRELVETKVGGDRR